MWRVKVCGLTTIQDAEFAWEEGADALGFVLERTSPRCLTDFSVLAFPLEDAVKVAVFGEFIGDEVLGAFDIVQAVGRNQAVGQPWMPVYRPRVGTDVSDWLVETRHWDWCLLDPYHENLAGGTGTTVEWDKAAEFVERFDGRVMLAGGLGPGNVREAILRVKPFGVDASSRLETSPGLKDGDLVQGYVCEAWDALCVVHGRGKQDLWDETAAIRLDVSG